MFEVTLAIVADQGSEAEALARVPPELCSACRSVVAISRPSAAGWPGGIQNPQLRVLAEALWPLPFEFARFGPAIGALARRLKGQNFDVVHCFRLYCGRLWPLHKQGISIGRSILDLDDHESRAKSRLIRYLPGLVGRQFAAVALLEVIKWALIEKLLIPRFDDVFVCSAIDREQLSRRFPRNRWHVVPNTVAVPRAANLISHDIFTFFFVGTFHYPANVDAVAFFCEQVLPILRRRVAMPFRVLIVGRGGDKLGRLKAVEGVEIIGDPLDIAPFYARADVAIVPLRAGGGTRIKILEAFSYGVPVISTTIGAEGLKVTPGSDILIADDPEAFADECCRMIADESLRQRIAAAGRNLWESEYTPAALTSILSTIFRANIRTQPEATL